MATIYLHIGAPKTATSTLQAVLSKHAKKLLKQGVLYPEDCRTSSAHHPLISDLIERYQGHRMPDMWYGDVPRGESWERLRQEIDRHGDSVKQVVISSELFFGQANHLPQKLQDIVAELSGHDLKMVVYLRRQDALYSSFYNQDIKGARQWCDSAYEFYQTHQMFMRDYHALLSAWGDALGRDNVLIRPFESSQWHEGDIVADFCHTTGLPPLTAGSIESNESLGPNQLYIKRCLNRVGFDKGLNEQVLKVVTSLCAEKASGQWLYINRGQYGRYREQWQRTNAQLSQDFLHAKHLFHQPVPPADELELYTTDRSRLMDYVTQCASYFKRRKGDELRPLFARACILLVAEQNLWDELDSVTRDAVGSWL